MPFELSWQIPRRVVLMRVWGEVTLHEITAQDAALHEWLREVEGPVHLLGDDRKVTRAPYAIQGLRLTLRLLRNKKLGHVYTIGRTHPVAEFLTFTFFTGAGIQYQRVRTLEDAMTKLYTVDPALERYEASQEPVDTR
jgi:hypothetical protein